MNTDSDTLDEEKQEPEHSDVDMSKLSEEFQQSVEKLLENATVSELDFVISEATEMKKSMNKSQNKAKLSTDSFSTEGMP